MLFASSYDLESYSLSVFGAHISLLALGVMALTAAAFSKSSDGLPMAVSGVVTVVMVLLTYAGYIGIYIGTLALVGTACLALVLMDLGVISGSGNLWRDVRLAVSVAAGTALLWLGVSGIALGLVDYLNLLDAVSGATFSAACALACVLAFRSGKHAKVATAATALTVLAGSVCVISLLFIRGLMY